MLERNLDEQIAWLKGKNSGNLPVLNSGTVRVDINLVLSVSSSPPFISKNTNEAYNLTVIQGTGGEITAEITAEGYFGARHGIESVFQLMEYDDLVQDFIMLSEATIEDEPEYQHRGISMDTSRNFMSKDVLKKIIDGMGASKVWRSDMIWTVLKFHL